ncbi:MAG: hypothetical protein ACXWOL_14230 [Ktedonobacteraceae bacterium]
MEKFSEFIDSLPKSTIVSLIAITIVILPIWIATGTPDFASQVSFFALAVALPMLVLEFVLCQLPEQFFRSKVNKALRVVNQIVGTDAALIGVVAALWHGSQLAAIAFSISYVFCVIIIVRIGRSYWLSLKKDKKHIEELEKQQVEIEKQHYGYKKRFEQFKKQFEEFKKNPDMHESQISGLEKQFDEFEKRYDEFGKSIDEHQIALTTTASKYGIVVNKPS